MYDRSSNTAPPHIAIVGGGLAGLAAAVALVERDCSVELFEARRKLGGRAGSFFEYGGGNAGASQVNGDPEGTKADSTSARTG